MSSITIKRYDSTLNSNQGGFETLHPITVGQNIYGSGTNALVPLLDNNDKINADFIPSGIGGSSGILEVNTKDTSVTTIALDSNKYYDFGGRSGQTITITFISGETGYFNEYMWEISSDESDVTLVTPSSIIWNSCDGVTNSNNTLTLESTKTYQFSVVHNRGLIVVFENGQLNKPIITISNDTVSWSAVNNAEKYEVFVDNISQGDQTATSYNLANAVASPTKLGTPTNLTASIAVLSDYSWVNTVQLNWSSVSNATKYEIVDITNSNYTKESNTNSYKTVGAILNYNLTNGNTYTFKVRAKEVTANASVYVKAKSSYNKDATSDSGTYNHTAYYASDYQTVSITIPYYVNSSLDHLTISETGNYTGSTIGSTSYGILPGGTLTLTLVSDNGYSLPSTITVSGASYTYNSSTGEIVLSNPTDNITITASANVITYSITTNLTNLTSDYDGTGIDVTRTQIISFIPDTGYNLPSTVYVSGATQSYNSTTGELTLSDPTGNVTIIAEGVSNE